MSKSKEKKEEKPAEKTLLDYTPEQWAVLVKEIGNQFREYAKVKGTQSKSLAWPVYLIIALVFVGVVGLAAIGIIEGQSVAFLAGTVVGYLLTYLGGYVTPEE